MRELGVHHLIASCHNDGVPDRTVRDTRYITRRSAYGRPGAGSISQNHLGAGWLNQPDGRGEWPDAKVMLRTRQRFHRTFAQMVTREWWQGGLGDGPGRRASGYIGTVEILAQRAPMSRRGLIVGPRPPRSISPSPDARGRWPPWWQCHGLAWLADTSRDRSFGTHNATH
jgi:hypothetical protein